MTPPVALRERGSSATCSLVAAIARALNTTDDELLGLKEPKEKGLFADRRFALRLQKTETLSKRKKEALLTTINQFLKSA